MVLLAVVELGAHTMYHWGDPEPDSAPAGGCHRSFPAPRTPLERVGTRRCLVQGVLDRVLGLFTGLLDVRRGLIGPALRLQALVAGRPTGGFLDLAGRFLAGVLDLVSHTHHGLPSSWSCGAPLTPSKCPPGNDSTPKPTQVQFSPHRFRPDAGRATVRHLQAPTGSAPGSFRTGWEGRRVSRGPQQPVGVAVRRR